MKENNPQTGSFSAPVAIEMAKLKLLLETLITVEANQRALMWGQAAILQHVSNGQFSVAEWLQKLQDTASKNIDILNREHVQELSSLAAMLEKAHKPQSN